LQEAAAALADATCRAFGGLYVRSRTEQAAAKEGRLLSIFFLVPRENVGLFREAFRRLQGRAPEKMLLTGPWPPYNFAAL
jgi:hypothetical protein